MEATPLRRWQYRIFALLWAGYASYYLCRVNFAVAQPLILREFTDWTSAQIGLIPSVYAACYAIGQFVNGQIGDRVGARRMMTAAIVIAAITNLLFSMTSSFAVMLTLWGINGFVQSAGWSLLVKTMSDWTTVRRRGFVIGLISTCYQVGNVASWLLAGYLCQKFGWRAAFWVPSLVLFPMAIVFAVGLRNRPEDAGLPPVRDDLQRNLRDDLPTVEKLTAREILRETLSNRILWILAIGYFCMNSVRYAFMNWAVQYMADFHGQPIKNSAFMAVALPLIGSAGAIWAGWASDHLFGKRRAPVCALMLFGLAAVCLGFILIPQGAWLMATVLLGLAGFLIYGPDMLMSGAASVDASHPSTAAASTGFIMSMGATGAIFSGAGVGWLKDASGGEWNLIFMVLSGLAVVSALLMVSIWNARPKGAA